MLGLPEEHMEYKWWLAHGIEHAFGPLAHSFVKRLKKQTCNRLQFCHQRFCDHLRAETFLQQNHIEDADLISVWEKQPLLEEVGFLLVDMSGLISRQQIPCVSINPLPTRLWSGLHREVALSDMLNNLRLF